MSSLLNIGNLGWGEWGVIFLLVLLLFGTKRLPELARNIGRSLRQFRHGLKELKEEIEKEPEKPKKENGRS